MIKFRALLAVVLLLNGLALPPATALHAATGTASHAGHPPDSAPARPSLDGSHLQHSDDVIGGDCCDAGSCECGCAAPHATTMPVSLPRNSWRTALAEFAFVMKSIHSSPLLAPFRPPA